MVVTKGVLSSLKSGSPKNMETRSSPSKAVAATTKKLKRGVQFSGTDDSVEPKKKFPKELHSKIAPREKKKKIISCPEPLKPRKKKRNRNRYKLMGNGLGLNTEVTKLNPKSTQEVDSSLETLSSSEPALKKMKEAKNTSVQRP